jgi:NTE family protein
MLFHAGALWRLQELGFLNSTDSAPRAKDLGSLERVSSVSGGSIIAGVLALNWAACRASDPDPQVRREAFRQAVITPIRAFSEVSVAGFNAAGAVSLLGAILLPGSVNEHVTRAYRKHLFGDATLQDLPDSPLFVINASNLQSGALWRFSKPYMRDWRVGEIRDTRMVSLAQAVSASSAFPPPLSPAILRFDTAAYTPGSGGEGTDNLQRPPFTTHVMLSDGGVYDNLGLETAFKRYKTLLVSNAGKPFAFEEAPGIDWASQGARVIGLMDNQVRSLRVRQLIEAFKPGAGGSPAARTGGYWGIDSDIAKFPCRDPLSCPFARTSQLAAVATDLARKEPALQEQLINWGYAICDAMMRSHVDPDLPAPTAFPYAGGVG